jgi:ABC-type sugar transport system ATPase subunit
MGRQENAFVTEGMVELTEMLGDDANVYVDIDADKSILKVTPHEIPAMDEKVTFSIPVESVYLFDAKTEMVIK